MEFTAILAFSIGFQTLCLWVIDTMTCCHAGEPKHKHNDDHIVMGGRGVSSFLYPDLLHPILDWREIWYTLQIHRYEIHRLGDDKVGRTKDRWHCSCAACAGRRHNGPLTRHITTLSCLLKDRLSVEVGVLTPVYWLWPSLITMYSLYTVETYSRVPNVFGMIFVAELEEGRGSYFVRPSLLYFNSHPHSLRDLFLYKNNTFSFWPLSLWCSTVAVRCCIYVFGCRCKSL